MTVLPKTLKDLKIKSLTDFNKCLYSNQVGPLLAVRADRLETDFFGYEVKDNEIHWDLIEFTNLIIDVEQLTVFPKAGTVLKNCIFKGKICINGRDSNGSEDSSTIEIDNCIFLDELIITGFIKMHNENISIFHTNCAYVSLFNINASEIIIAGCSIFFFALHKINALKLEAENNYFKHFEIESVKFDKVVFDHRQLDINSIGKRIIKNKGDFQFKTYSQLPVDINLFSFISYKTSADIKRSQGYNTMLETIDFYKNSTSLSFDRNKYMKLMFFDVLLAQDEPFNKAFVWITGGFLEPYRFIIMAIVVLVLFSGVYMLPWLEFHIASGNLVGSLSFDQALYFSGITFETVGYGDISPLGGARVFAVVEGVLGISIMSSFLVALVKKYID